MTFHTKLNELTKKNGYFGDAALKILLPKEAKPIYEQVQKVTILNGLLDDAYKALVFNIYLSEAQKMQLQSQDILYDSLQDVENLEDLLGGYLQEMIKVLKFPLNKLRKCFRPHHE